MEGSESEAIFDSLNLNPQLFINEVLNSVDDLVDSAFDFFHQRASTMLKIEGTDRADDLSKGVVYIRDMIQSVLDKRLSVWEKYCLQQCFVVPEGFTLPKANESAGDSPMDLDAFSDQELDAQLDSLRNKLASVGKENAQLNRELCSLERQIVSSNHFAGSVNEALKLYEQHSVRDMFEELMKTASELRKKMEQLKTKRLEQTDRLRTEKMHISNGDLFAMNHGDGLSNVTLKELQEFMADIKNSFGQSLDRFAESFIEEMRMIRKQAKKSCLSNSDITYVNHQTEPASNTPDSILYRVVANQLMQNNSTTSVWWYVG